jgi:hypothetical protein
MKTTADVPPGIANEYAKAQRPSAISQATGDGYTTTKAMQKGLQQPKQYGLPKSGKKPPIKMGGGPKGFIKDADKDQM